MPPSPIKKRRGPPKGNLNALKHGFYTSRFNRDELLAADKVDSSALTDEILFVRLLLRRLIDQPGENITFQERCAATRVFFLGCLALTRLFKVQQVLGKGAGESTLDAAIDQVAKEFHLDDPDYYRKNPPPPVPDTSSLYLSPAIHHDERYQTQVRLIEQLKNSNDALRHSLFAAQIQISKISGQDDPPSDS